MSVNTHLTSTASQIIITDTERGVIDNHIVSLRSKLNSYFKNSEVSEQLAFGSYTRKTLMPRKADPRSDVDYMIIFSSSVYTTNTYLRWLKEFAENKYTTSEIYQSHPTVVLELSKIKIELVPATKNSFDDYQIPAPSSSYSSWLTTHPNAFNTKVTNKNVNEKKLIRPLIRIMKYWNAKNDYVYSSYELEQLIVDQIYYSCNNLADYLYLFVSNLSSYNVPSYKAEKIERLKTICANASRLDSTAYFSAAEEEIKKAIPAY